MIRKPDSRDNLHSVYVTLQPLGIEGVQCHRRLRLGRQHPLSVSQSGRGRRLPGGQAGMV